MKRPPQEGDRVVLTATDKDYPVGTCGTIVVPYMSDNGQQSHLVRIDGEAHQTMYFRTACLAMVEPDE